MRGIRHEEFHYTREQVAAHIRDALAVVEEAAPPADLRPITFERALNMLATKNISIEAVGVGVPAMTIPRGA